MSEHAAPAGPPSPLPPGLGHGGELDLPGGPDAALLLHGLTGSTFELHFLAHRLAASGLHALAPVMAGHGGAAEGLRGVGWPAWVDGARSALARLAGARRVFLLGSSMGGLVASALAAEAGARIDALVLLAPALELTWPGRLGMVLGRLPLLDRRVVSKGRSDVRDPPARALDIGLPGLPLSALAELRALARRVDALLPGVTAPALVLLGARDRTVTARGVRRLLARLGGPAEIQILPESGHLLGVDLERDRCAAEVLRFLAPLRRPGPGTGPDEGSGRPAAQG